MSNEEDHETDEDIAFDVLPMEVVEKAVPLELTQLSPWHRPRKQFVRQNQWLYLVKNLVGKISNTHWLPVQASGIQELKYLTLPGIDYFDVKVIGEYCKTEGISVTSTGFLAGQETNPHVARAKLRETALVEAGLISIQSHTTNRRLEEVAHDGSSAYRELKRRGPFHVVNIDACGSISPSANDDPQRIVNAIYKIIEYQLSACSGRWLLFLTTDARKETLSADTATKFAGAIAKNAQNSADFKASALALFEATDENIADALKAAQGDIGSKFVQFFALGFSKWLLHMVESKHWKMKVHSSYYYSTDVASIERPTMPCLAFEFLPPSAALADPNNIASVASANDGVVFDAHMRAVKKVSEMSDLDQRLANDDDLRLGMALATEQLLRDAGYAASAISSLAV